MVALKVELLSGTVWGWKKWETDLEDLLVYFELERKLEKKLLGEMWEWNEMDFVMAWMTANHWKVM